MADVIWSMRIRLLSPLYRIGLNINYAASAQCARIAWQRGEPLLYRHWPR